MYLLLYIFLISLLHPNLIQPAHLDTLSKIHVLFEWEQEPNTLEYNLQISTSNTFDQLIVDTVLTNLIYIDKYNINWNGDYYWRLRTRNPEHNFREWIDEKVFHI